MRSLPATPLISYSLLSPFLPPFLLNHLQTHTRGRGPLCVSLLCEPSHSHSEPAHGGWLALAGTGLLSFRARRARNLLSVALPRFLHPVFAFYFNPPEVLHEHDTLNSRTQPLRTSRRPPAPLPHARLAGPSHSLQPPRHRRASGRRSRPLHSHPDQFR